MVTIQGEIYIVTFPFTDLRSTKKRPAIVISSSDVNSTEDVILAAITSKLHNDIFSFKLLNEELIPPLRLESEVRCNKLFTINQSLLERRVSKVTDAALSKLLQKVKAFL